jgi:hypothetical protein
MTCSRKLLLDPNTTIKSASSLALLALKAYLDVGITPHVDDSFDDNVGGIRR